MIEQYGDVHLLEPSLLIAGVYYGAAVFVLLADLLPLGAGVIFLIFRGGCRGLILGRRITFGCRFGRTIGQSAGDTQCQRIDGFVRFARLLGHHPLWIQLLLGLLHRIEVDVCGDLHPEVAGAQHGIEHVAGTLTNVLLQLAHILHLLHALLAKPGLVAEFGTQQLASLIDNGDRPRFHAGDTACHQVGNGLDLAGLHGLTGLQIEHDGCTWLLLVTTDKESAFGNGEMDAGTAHRIQRNDGARQFAFQCMAIAGTFHKLTGAETGDIVQPLQTRRHGRSHPSGRQGHTNMGQLILRHQNLARALLQPERHLLLLQHLHDIGGIVELLLAVQGDVVFAGRPQNDDDCAGNDGSQQSNGQDRFIVTGEAAPVAKALLHACSEGIRSPLRGRYQFSHHLPQSGMRIMSSKPVISLLRTCIRAEKLRPAF